MYLLCYDVGGIDIKMGIVNEHGTIINKKAFPTEPLRSANIIVSDMISRADILLSELNLTRKDIAAIGIGLPGLANNKDGKATFCPNLFWQDVPIRKMFKKEYDIPIYLLNDATIAAIAEHKSGACKGAKNSLTITLGTGLGGGIVINDRLYEGSNGGSGEFGHMTIVPDGEPCNCGNRGCFETYASVSALIRCATNAANEYRDSMLAACMKDSPLTGKTVIDCAKAGDTVALDVFHSYIRYLSIGISSLINIFDPEMIAIGGGLANAGDFLISELSIEANKKRLFSMLPPVKIVRAKHLNDAGIIGAAFFCIQELQQKD